MSKPRIYSDEQRIERQKGYKHDYYMRNRERDKAGRLAYWKTYSAKNKEQLAAKVKLHRKAHPEVIKTYLSRIKATWFSILKDRGMMKCCRCGYDKCFAAIDFHHIEPKQKKYQIGKLLILNITPERLEELNKVIALCANCHRELHYGK